MRITYLGQAGLLFEIDGKKILIDPYLSDNVKNYEPQNYRRQPIDENFLHIKPDVIIITHNHLDHLDKETLKYYFTEESEMLVLAPNGGYQELRKYGGSNNYVMFNVGTTWNWENVAFKAVFAEHSDPCAIGVIISVDGKNYYVTGDTLYNEKVFASLGKEDIYALFLPVNGKGNNMNMTDASLFSKRVAPKYVIPFHIGMFDELTADNFDADNKVIPEIYKEIKI